jgi:lipid A 3-O-deacylase
VASILKLFGLPLVHRLMRSAAIIAVCCSACAQQLQLESTGLRFGFSPASNDDKFHQAELSANWNLPWGWALGSRWHLQTRMDVSAGWLGDPGGDAFGQFPLNFEAGVSPTLLSRHEFATKDFGAYFQFTSHVGLNWDLSSRFRVGYRFQHMSNAGIAEPNPGLNLHMVGVSYLF